MIVNVCRISSNVGDLRAKASDYFPDLQGTTVDYCNIQESDCRGKDVIVGGTGCVMTHVPDRIATVGNLPRWADKSVAWGVGTNDNNFAVPDYTALADYGLVGVRDFGVIHEWVPCPSCMHPAFDKEYPIADELRVYAHNNVNLVVDGIPRMINCGVDIDDVIAFLAGAATILTTSYHGAYWATLLGRRVVVISPFSSKFMHYKHRPVIAREEEYMVAVKQTVQYPEALIECRAANCQFADRVRDYIFTNK